MIRMENLTMAVDPRALGMRSRSTAGTPASRSTRSDPGHEIFVRPANRTLGHYGDSATVSPMPMPWEILVPLSALADRRQLGALTTGLPPRDIYLRLDPRVDPPPFKDQEFGPLVRAVAELLRTDPHLAQAFRLARLALTMRSSFGIVSGGSSPIRTVLSRSSSIELVVVPDATIKSCHSTRRLTYLMMTPHGYTPATTEGASHIILSGRPADLLRRLHLVRRSILHELAHCVHHHLQASGIPYSGRDRRHFVREIRTAPFAYVEGEPQAFLLFLDGLVDRIADEDGGSLVRRPRARRAWVRRLLTANQFLRSELACGYVLAALLTDTAIRRHFLSPSFYRLVAAAYPGLRQKKLTRQLVRRTITPEDNAYIKYQFVRLKYDPGNTLQFLQAYLEEFPAIRRRVLRVIARASGGLLLSTAAARRNLNELSARIVRARVGDESSRQRHALVRRENREWLRALVRCHCNLVGDARTPLIVRTDRGEVDLNRASAEEFVKVLGIDQSEALKIVTNRSSLRAGEYLDLLDLIDPRPRALTPGAVWRELTPAAYGFILSQVQSSGVSESPLRQPYRLTTGSVQPKVSQILSGM